MKCFRQGRRWLAALAVAGFTFSDAAQSNTNVVLHTGTLTIPAAIMPPPIPPSPMDYFRNLLAMSPEEREKALADKPPEIRARILAKVIEYATLDPRESEVRLRATELRWYLMPLLRAAPADRATGLALVPDNIRDLVKSRLMQWEVLPPPLQQEFLENEHIVSYFSSVDTTNRLTAESAPNDDEQSRWNALSDNERKTMTAQFNAFFELPPPEKEKALDGLSDEERGQVQKAMQTFGQLPPPQRAECMQALAKFDSLSSAERAAFLKNAQRWAQMSPADRKAWIDLVTHVPQWPPAVPAMLMPPMPPPRPDLHPLAVTNHT
jgi:Protein of unknown function (DUF3106)